jgi:hypothetical protein
VETGGLAQEKWRQYLLGVWSRKQSQPEVAALYQSKLLIARRLLRRWVDERPGLKLPVTFDNWYTQPAFCRFLDQELELPYVGTLASDDEVILKRGHLTLEEFAQQLKQEHFQAVAAGGRPVFHKIGITQPSPIAYCVPPHTTKRSCTSFNVNSRWISKAAHCSGVGLPKPRACGLWLASSAQD